MLPLLLMLLELLLLLLLLLLLQPLILLLLLLLLLQLALLLLIMLLLLLQLLLLLLLLAMLLPSALIRAAWLRAFAALSAAMRAVYSAARCRSTSAAASAATPKVRTGHTHESLPRCRSFRLEFTEARSSTPARTRTAFCCATSFSSSPDDTRFM